MEETNVVYLNADKMDGQDLTAEQTQPAAEEMTLQQATQLFNTFDRVNALKKIREEMNQNRTQTIGGSEAADKISTLIAGLTPEQIAELSDEAVDTIYGDIQLTVDLDEKTKPAFKRDFLVYLRETDIANEQFDKEAEALEAAMAEHQAEMNDLVSEFGDLSTFMRAKLQEQLDEATGARKERVAGIIDAYDDSYTLNRVVEHYKKFGVQNTVSDYYHRADGVFERYQKVIKKLNFRTDLTTFENVEPRFLEEKYQVHPNLFVFSIIKMYSFKKDATPEIDGVFLSQLAVNLKSLYADSFGSEEKKETFKAGIRQVLDLFLGE